MQFFKSWLNIGVNVAKSLIDGQAVESWEREQIVLLDGQHWGLVLVDADGHHAARAQRIGGEKLDSAVGNLIAGIIGRAVHHRPVQNSLPIGVDQRDGHQFPVREKGDILDDMADAGQNISELILLHGKLVLA